MSHILFSSIQNHDNTEQARIYPAKLKDIVPGRQSGIIAGLNKCKILTGTNASNGSRTRGYIFPFCSPPLVGMYLCSLSSDHPGRLGEACPPPLPLSSPASCTSLEWMRTDINIKYEREREKRKGLASGWNHALNLICEETHTQKKEPGHQPAGVSHFNFMKSNF